MISMGHAFIEGPSQQFQIEEEIDMKIVRSLTQLGQQSLEDYSKECISDLKRNNSIAFHYRDYTENFDSNWVNNTDKVIRDIERLKNQGYELKENHIRPCDNIPWVIVFSIITRPIELKVSSISDVCVRFS